MRELKCSTRSQYGKQKRGGGICSKHVLNSQDISASFLRERFKQYYECVLYKNIYFLPHRDHSVFPLERAKNVREKLFIGKVMLNT